MTDMVHDDFARSPVRVSDLPARVRVLAYRAEVAQDVGTLLAGALGVDGGSLEGSVVPWDGGFIKITRSGTHQSFAIWSTGLSEVEFGDSADGAMGLGAPEEGKLTSLDIVVTGTVLENPEARFGGQTVYAGAILDGSAQVLTSYQPDSAGCERYLVMPLADKFVGQIESIIDSITELENSFHLVYEHGPDIDEQSDRLRAIEVRGAGVLRTIHGGLRRAGTAELKSWLADVADDYAQLAELYDGLSSRMADALALRDTLKGIFSQWRERSVEGMAGLSQPILALTLRKTSEYGRLLGRVEAARRRRSDIINVIRARLDVLEREQAFALQRSMHETAKTQMAMQRSIEGLYVFIVAFYLTELARLLFEALSERHLIRADPTVLAAGFIPVAILAGLLLSGKVKEWVERIRRRRFS